ncbi:MAG: phosphoglucosamine mutase [Rhodospirillales bacterium]|jgi:phosphoglucosamine mutase|tara:strand:- start:3628 stop:4974 length:1347 start_codon:yes stop_codon:yes gene_type:complete
MTTKLFGTDGIRGTANRGNMTAEVALKVGMAAALQFRNGDHRNRVVIGKDTRLSGYLLEPALTAGFISMGMDVILVGPMPTPAIAMLTRSLRADLGVMISASHNPFQDNGIKLFGPDGYKLSDAVEAEIEANVADGMSKNMIAPSKLGRAKRLYDAGGRYTEFVKRTFPRGQTLDGLKIVIDCANGAAYKVAPEVLWELGAEVIPVGVDPDGYNINKGCGSTDTDYMCSQVVSHGADIGIALDGDADRLMVCDEQGAMVDGDQIMALIAKNWLDRDLLKGGGLVATVMSNLGLEKYLNSIGLNLERTKVGDRYVVEHMRANGFNIGGEQSGHIVLGEHLTTGDGLVAALQILAVVVASDGPASKVTRLFDPLPQLLKNVRYGIGQPLEDTLVKNAIKEGEARLSDTGRVLIRKSGTEAMIRVMAEGEDESLILSVVDNIVSAVEHAAS